MATAHVQVANELEEALRRPGSTPDVPIVELPQIPRAATLWRRALVLASVLVTLFTIDRLTVLLGDYWLLQSMQLESVFWTNFWEGAWLYVTGFITFGAAVAAPAFVHRVESGTRRVFVNMAFLVASVAAYNLSMTYLEFLLGGIGLTFSKTDPVFNNDIGFYVYNLPNIWVAWDFAMWAASILLVSSLVTAYLGSRDRQVSGASGRTGRVLATVGTPFTAVALAIFGLTAAIGVWLTRYDLLLKRNSDSSVARGAEYVDVTGLFSNLNYILVTTLVVLGVTGAVIAILRGMNQVAEAGSGSRQSAIRTATYVAVALIGFDFAFKAAVVVRDVILVRPNEPVVQLPYIQRHIDATRAAFKMDKIQEVNFTPSTAGDPLPDADALLASPTLRNAPLWPGYISYLESWLDDQHSRRILQTGDPMVYGPTLEVFRQQQKLRTYYNFLNVDTVRYRIGDEKKMLVSAVRETPLFEPVPWLAYWGQRFMLYTHGFGLAIAPTGEVNKNGEPNYISYDIPPRTTSPEISVNNQRVYYGEGSATMAFSNVDRMKELDYPTEQDRAENVLPTDANIGIPIDSFLKRLVFGWRSGKFFELVFSDLINDGTRVHYYRSPIERLERAAPFLYYDTNPYAVAADGKIMWLVNGMTTADKYPYSLPEELGDKSDERAQFPRPERWVNYVEDSVKATVDAYTGEVKLYKIADEPVANAWQKIYPDLFTSGDQMPAPIRAQLTYPTQLLHLQFDDLYIYYHMRDPMYYFNMEDMWDDGDEVLGPILDTGKAITFSIEPYPVMLDTTNGVLPRAQDPVQFSYAMIFTPEKALNLRAIPVVYQDGTDYGRLFVLQIPKGQFIPGPEQADAAIDQDPFISQNFSWWNRMGTQVIRGHTSLLLVGKEVLYVEPIFLRSQQNPVTQLKRVIVVFRGKPYMAESLDAAIRTAVSGTSPGELSHPDLGSPKVASMPGPSAAAPAPRGN
jgi:uncharacterized membrane protein (UPF0182 family)